MDTRAAAERGRSRDRGGTHAAAVPPARIEPSWAAALLAVQRHAGNRAATFAATSPGRILASRPPLHRQQQAGAPTTGQQPANACATGTAALTTTATNWITAAVAALAPLAVTAPPGGRQGGAATATAAVQGLFATTDPAYVRLLQSRLRHMGGALGGRVRVTCGGTGCRSQGSAFVGAYVARPYEVVMCSANPSTALARTFVHELAHATLPDVGVRRSAGGEGVADRAYTHERLFGRLTTEEALDNAESYGQLVAVLGGGQALPAATTRNDTVSDPSQAQAVGDALAHMEVWVRFAEAQLHAVGQAFGQPGAGNDPQVAQVRSMLSITTAADAVAASRLLQQLSSFLRNATQVEVAGASSPGLGSVGRASFTAAGPGPGLRRRSSEVTVTPGWVAADADTRKQVLFALFFLQKHPREQPSRAWQFATFARAVGDRRVPSVAGGTAAGHQQAEARFEHLEDRARWFRVSGGHADALRRRADLVARGDHAGAARLLHTSVGQAHVQTRVRALLSVQQQGALGLDPSDPEVEAAGAAYREAVRAHHLLMNASARLAPIAGGALVATEQAARNQTSRLIARAAQVR